MKLPIAVLICASVAVACSRQSEPPGTADTPPPAGASPPPAHLETAPVAESAPVPTGLPTGPQVAPPTPAPAPPADQTPLTLTPAAGTAPGRASAQLAPSTPAQDKPKSSADRESIREIRALLTADKDLAPFASRVAIVARDGRVWLRGQVNTAEQRAAVERVARQAAGVINVDNELVVSE